MVSAAAPADRFKRVNALTWFLSCVSFWADSVSGPEAIGISDTHQTRAGFAGGRRPEGRPEPALGFEPGLTYDL